MENRDELDELFYQALRGKTVTAEMARAIEWVEGRVKHLIRAKCVSRAEYATLQSDLAWCLGKLRGLGHPAEEIEKRREPNLEGDQDAKHN